MELNIYQIYYDDSQLSQLTFKPYDNKGKLLPTFENAVIADLARRRQLFKGDVCGVLSWAWKIKTAAANAYTEEKLEALMQFSDVVGFHPFYEDKRMKHNPFTIGNSWHRTAPQFTEILSYLLSAIGKPHDLERVPRQSSIVYSNAWVAKPEVYRKYYNEYLKPALKVCEQMPIKEWLWQDCGYTKNKNPRIKLQLREELGVPYYPTHPFVLERLPIVFLEQNPEIVVTHMR